VIGIDSNVLLRFLLRDDAAQAARAQALLKAVRPLSGALVSPIVLAELTWTLDRQGRSRSEIAGFVENVLATDGIHVAFGEAARRAVVTYRKTRADYADCLLAETNAVLGASPTYTFDRDAIGTPHFAPLPA
jgi:predicted nucleic-acid-binding protein